MGIWIGEQESSKFWLKVLTDLQNRGVKDLLIACTDGLQEFTEAFSQKPLINSVLPQIRNSWQYVAAKDQKEFLIDLKRI